MPPFNFDRAPIKIIRQFGGFGQASPLPSYIWINIWNARGAHALQDRFVEVAQAGYCQIRYSHDKYLSSPRSRGPRSFILDSRLRACYETHFETRFWGLQTIAKVPIVDPGAF